MRKPSQEEQLQCDQIEQFFKVLAENICFKSSPNELWLLGCFEKQPFSGKNCIGNNSGSFWKHLASFLYHLVTLNSEEHKKKTSFEKKVSQTAKRKWELQPRLACGARRQNWPVLPIENILFALTQRPSLPHMLKRKIPWKLYLRWFNDRQTDWQVRNE